MGRNRATEHLVGPARPEAAEAPPGRAGANRALEPAAPQCPARSLAPRERLSERSAAGRAPDCKPQHAPGQYSGFLETRDLLIIGASWELIQLFSRICVKTPH